MAFINYYVTLGVSQNASPEEISRAFREQAKKFHPDVNKAPEASELFKKANEAHQILSNAAKRQSFDRLYNQHMGRQHSRPFTESTYGEDFQGRRRRSARTRARETRGTRYTTSSQSYSYTRVTVNGETIFQSSGPSERESKSYKFTVNPLNAIRIDSMAGNIEFGLNSIDRLVTVEGSGTVMQLSGDVIASDFDGSVHIPYRPELTVIASTMSGDLSGEIFHPGKLRTMSGDIRLNTYGLAIKPSVMGGQIYAPDFIMSSGLLIPRGEPVPDKQLRVSTMSGDIYLENRL